MNNNGLPVSSSQTKLGDQGTLESNWRSLSGDTRLFMATSRLPRSCPQRRSSRQSEPAIADDNKPLSRDHVWFLRLAATIEVIEADLRQQCNEFGVEGRSAGQLQCLSTIFPSRTTGANQSDSVRSGDSSDEK